MPTNRQRRDAARRHLDRQLQRREQRDVVRKRRVLIGTVAGTVVLALVVVIFVIAVTNDDKKPAASSPTSAAVSDAPAGMANCVYPSSGTAARKVTKPATVVAATGTVNATVKTTRGTMTFTLDRKNAPCNVANFLSLAKQKYYDQTSCHRLVTQGIFVLQCGDPTGTGNGGPGYTVPDELDGSEQYTAGALAMANTGQPDTAGSQFFIVYKNSPTLINQTSGPQYTILGKVSKGLSVVQAVAAKGSNPAGDGKPKLPIKLTSVVAAASSSTPPTPSASASSSPAS